ncbi:response regulator [Dyadobacter sp. CY347]|uniref:response regulator n=1 Tax=Dyadobacter sp. CY347 TaxID=2909336 RepID=UPI001F301366|nr:response regulator [Dyadobacter sp. CY347]MCF2487561.1 response regulator [Dyadobacter sp. CY347]
MLANKTVYIVDDDSDDRMLLREALENVIEGIEVLEFIDGQLLLEALADNLPKQPALILMDMNMPRLTGMETLERIKGDPLCRHIPVVMVSTSSNAQLIRRCYDNGVNAYIVKPVIYEGYIEIAQAVSICFLNSYPEFEGQVLAKNFNNKSILVIEDNHDHWQMMRAALKMGMPDVKVVHRSSQDSTVEFLENEYASLNPPVEMILLDLYLPSRHEGLSLLADIRNFITVNNLPPVPVIVLSYSDHPNDIIESYAGQASAYLLKTGKAFQSFSSIRHVCSLWWATVTLP